jgi:hypothetical protein
MAHDVFISHSHEDKLLADAVCAELESAGIRCWIAPRDVLAGRDWAESIVEAVDAARVMVLIYSANSANSEHVKKELTIGVKSGTIIVPLRIQDVPLSGMMEYYLVGTHWLDAMDPPSQHEISALVNTVATLLAGANRSDAEPHDAATSPMPEQPQPVPTGMVPESKKRSWAFVAVLLAIGLGIALTVAVFFIYVIFIYQPTGGEGTLTLSWAHTDDLDIELYSGDSGDYVGASWEVGGLDSNDGTAGDERLVLSEIADEYLLSDTYFVAVINNSTTQTEWVDFVLTIEASDGTVSTYAGRVNGFPPQDEWVACVIDASTGEVIEDVGLYVDGTDDGSGEGVSDGFDDLNGFY